MILTIVIAVTLHIVPSFLPSPKDTPDKNIIINNYYIEPQYHSRTQSLSENRFNRISYF